ncbi:hypothetical protein ACLI09_17750 [Flavobacterium sp. RHBU_24]|uniref:hypothetical protein n=1 Tax=Flavobacterium sp. RHBU_24 TaxID=3391185 RepID=UPI003985108C
MLNELWKYVGEIYIVVLILGFLFGLIFYKRLSVTGRYLLVYFGLMLVCQFASDYIGAILKNNHIMLPIYCMIELGFFIALFNIHFFKNFRALPLVTGAFAMAYIVGEFFYNFILHQVTIKDFQPYCKIADNFCIIIYCLLYLYEKMKYNRARTEKFPLTIGLLINFTLSSIFFLPFNFLVNQEMALTFYFWIGNAMLLVLYAGFLGFFIVSPVFERKFSRVTS